jgi:hypothetical protein
MRSKNVETKWARWIRIYCRMRGHSKFLPLNYSPGENSHGYVVYEKKDSTRWHSNDQEAAEAALAEVRKDNPNMTFELRQDRKRSA